MFKGNVYQKICDMGWMFSLTLAVWNWYYLRELDALFILYVSFVILFIIGRELVFKNID